MGFNYYLGDRTVNVWSSCFLCEWSGV